MINEAVRAALYCRVSTGKQVKHGESLDDQNLRLTARAKSEGWKVVHTYVEQGVTGAKDDRPELQNLMLDARLHRFDIVVVDKVDRAFRNERLFQNYLYDLQQLGINFVSLSEGIDTRIPGANKILVSLFGTFAEMEHERISERIRDFRNHRAAVGQWSSGRTPFGYRFNKEIKQLEIFEPEAEAVRFLFNEYVNKHLGVNRLAEVANEAGYLTPRANRKNQVMMCWTQTAIHHVLTHPAYQGGPNPQWIFHTPAIIDTELWEASQFRLKNNRHFRPANKSGLEFKGRIKCGLCGRTLRVGYNHKGLPIYECVGRLHSQHLDGSPTCTQPRRLAHGMEFAIRGEITKMVDNFDVFKQQIKVMMDNLQTQREQLDQRLHPLKEELARIQDDINIANARLEMKQLTVEDYKARMSKLNKQRTDIEERQEIADPYMTLELSETDRRLELYQAILELSHEIEKPAKYGPGKVINLEIDKVNARMDKFDRKTGKIRYNSLSFTDEIEKSLELAKKTKGHMVPVGAGRSIFEAYRAVKKAQDYFLRDMFIVVFPDKIELRGTIPVRKRNVSLGFKRDIRLPLNISIQLDSILHSSTDNSKELVLVSNFGDVSLRCKPEVPKLEILRT